eukprot:CAMPEP_0168169720 /NCGR_PEP_ID=MMETSP0139_2-20121125/3789_1 /TAXON_ID=44445 /ORGANISM="Pseudo-nitzschia australis, Strain 10249 10 AB" /LENGTH=382 /DNA_ID=CAMNT_0008087159 /DNA_START=196 /DNA_END=1344 /DNA_ORIENTATION=-
MASSSATKSIPTHWRPLGPENFSSVISSKDGCRYAKDDEYLEAVLDSWKQDITTFSPQRVETSPWIYYDDDETPLYGHVVQLVTSKDDSMDVDKKATDTTGSDDGPTSLRPGILLFHTAAGPQDVFLFQKAADLAASSELGECVVFICDVLSDPDGWAWSPDGDRTKFNQVKHQLLQDNARLLRSRVRAAVRTLIGKGGIGSNVSSDFGVDPKRLASLGWCFGAQPILELATLQHQQDYQKVKADGTSKDTDLAEFSAAALISYHGVYRRDPPQSRDASLLTGTIDKEKYDREHTVVERDVLICTGKSDPFISRDDLESAKTVMEEKSYNVKIMEFDGAKHGFTNPAQDFNTNEAFQYNEHAATESWKATMDLLKQKLLPPQ